MEKATARAKALGKNLLFKAMGGSSTSGEEAELQATRKPTWSEVVSSPPSKHRFADSVRRAGMPLIPPAGQQVPPRGAGMPVVGMSEEGRRERSWQGSGRTLRREDDGEKSRPSPQRLFSADEVAKLVEIARNQLKKERAENSGWIEVESNDNKRKEKLYAKELVEEYRSEHSSSPETEVRCWQCDKTGHLSSACPKGERCFTCNRPGHKRAFCPMKFKASRAEKGKGIARVWEPERKNITVKTVVRKEAPIRIGGIAYRKTTKRGKERLGVSKRTRERWRWTQEFSRFRYLLSTEKRSRIMNSKKRKAETMKELEE